jgi:hypothetical protein
VDRRQLLPAALTGRAAVPAGLLALMALAAVMRTTQLDIGFWIDEGLSVGIADRPLGDIPATLRLDGSPPLFYALMHFWIDLVGTSEPAVRAFSLTCTLLAVPVAFWAARAVFGLRGGWIGAVLAATNPFLTQYGMEGRMYALVVLIGFVACATFARAFVIEPPGQGRRRWAMGFAVALAALLYTHNWTLFFAAACAGTWLVLWRRAPVRERGELVRAGLIGFGGAALLYLPWLPTMIDQTLHTGAPWSDTPSLGDLLAFPARVLGTAGHVALLLAAGAGIGALVTRERGRPKARAALAMAGLAVATVAIAWLASQLSPAWANRYLATGLAPLLMLGAGGLAHAGRLGVAGVIIVAILGIGTTPPNHKSNARDVAEAIGPALRPGDLVVVTQPEQVSVLDYYLPDGVRFATLTGPVEDPGVTDWRDGVERLEATSPERDLKPLLDRLPDGRRLALVQPVIYDLGRWDAPWTELVRIRSEQWAQYVSNDARFTRIAAAPADPPLRAHPLQALVLLKRG